MEKITQNFRVLNEQEQAAAYEKAERKLKTRATAWRQAQETFQKENPVCRNNRAFVAAVNKIITTEDSAKMTDREVLRGAFVQTYLAGRGENEQ